MTYIYEAFIVRDAESQLDEDFIVSIGMEDSERTLKSMILKKKLVSIEDCKSSDDEAGTFLAVWDETSHNLLGIIVRNQGSARANFKYAIECIDQYCN